MKAGLIHGALAALLMAATSVSSAAQSRSAATAQNGATAATAVALPADYVIGADDVLSVVFWREKDLSAQVRVRPDGKISLPLLNDVVAVGLTPEQLRESLQLAAKQYIEEPDATVLVLEINSRRVFVTGQVSRPGAFPLVSPMTVLQAIALAGGVLEYADAENISVVRNEGPRSVRLRFNYKDVSKGKKLEQNVALRPGDTVIVP